MAVLSREVIAPGYFASPRFWEKSQWMPPGWSYGINPLQEVNASIKSMEAGITTLADEASFQGRDWKRQLRAASKIKKMADNLGLVIQGVNLASKDLAIQAAGSTPALDPAQAEMDAEMMALNP